MGRMYGKTPSEMLFRAVAHWRIDEAATQALMAADDVDRGDEKKAKHSLLVAISREQPGARSVPRRRNEKSASAEGSLLNAES